MKARLLRSKAIGFAVAAAMALGCTAYGTGFTTLAFDGDYDNYFTFSDSGITAEDADGSGYKIKGTDLTINESGVYVVSGECVEGTITVKKGTTGVTLVLSDLHLTSTITAPVSVNKTAEATIVIDGENVITDAEDPANEDSEDADIADAFEGAAIKVKSGASVTFTGTGTLTADGSACKNGIKGGSEATVTVGENESDSFTINVSAANNALASDGTLTVNGGTVNAESADDGIKASPDDDDETSLGLININGGTVNVTAADDAIHGVNVNVNGGTVNVSAGDDGIKAEYVLGLGAEDTDGPTVNITKSTEGLEGATVNLYSGSGRIISSDDGINAANSDLSGYSYSLKIFGGSWYINADGDGLDSNGDLNVSGGYTEVFGSTMGDNAALDYGDNGNSFNVTGGTIVGVGMSRMATVPTSGSYIAFGSGSDMQQPGGQGGMPGEPGERPEMPEGDQEQMPGQGERPEMPEGEQRQMPEGDRPEMPEGEQGQMPEGDPPEMPEGEQRQFPGGQGMMPGQETDSAVKISAGDLLEIRDAEDNVLWSAEAPKSAEHIVYSSEELKEGEVYYLYINNVLTAASDGSDVNVPEENIQETEQAAEISAEPETIDSTVENSEEPETIDSTEDRTVESSEEPETVDTDENNYDVSSEDSSEESEAKNDGSSGNASGNTNSAASDNPNTGAASVGLGIGTVAAAILSIISRRRK